MNWLRTLLRTGPSTDEQVSAVEVIKRTPLDQLDETIRVLRRQRPAVELREALVERMGHAPLSEFEALKAIYLKYYADATDKS